MCVDPETVTGEEGKRQSQDNSHKIPWYSALVTSRTYDCVEADKVSSVVCSMAALLGGGACAGSMLYTGLSASDTDSFLVKNSVYTRVSVTLVLSMAKYWCRRLVIANHQSRAQGSC